MIVLPSGSKVTSPVASPITSAALYAGDLAPALDTIAHAPAPPETLPAGGAEIAALEILARLIYGSGG